MATQISRFFRDESGLEAVEYAVFTALIVAGVISALTTLAATIISNYNLTTTAVNGGG